jgi:Protein of unknown function (DUF1236)
LGCDANAACHFDFETTMAPPQSGDFAAAAWPQYVVKHAAKKCVRNVVAAPRPSSRECVEETLRPSRPQSMRRRIPMTDRLRLGTMALAVLGTVSVAVAQVPSTTPGGAPGGLNEGAITNQKLQLSAAQKTAIYNAVSKDKSKIAAPGNFRASIGAPVPSSIELYALPSEAVANAQAASSYRYTMVNNQVVLVDPLTMQVVDIIRQ